MAPAGGEIILTEKIERLVDVVLSTDSIPLAAKERLQIYKPQDKSKARKNILFDDVKLLYDQGKKVSSTPLYLHELLEGSELHLPQPKITPRNPELEARIQTLKARFANEEYERMTRNVGDVRAREKTDIQKELADDVKIMNSQLLSIFNCLITVVCAFVFGYKGLEYVVDDPTFGLRLGVGIVLASIVFLADLYFLVKNDM